MLAFISPLFLYAAAAVGGPVLIHLLLRNRPQRRILPTMRFLPNTAQQSVAMHRFKNMLLLALRMLVIVLLALAFARPYAKRPAAVNESQLAEQGVVFAVDTSMSMRATDRWTAVQNRVITLNRLLPEGSPRALVLFDRTPRILCAEGSSASVIESAINAEHPTYGATDLVAGIRTAMETASSMKAKSRKVHLISDFQNTGFKQIGVDIGGMAGIDLIPTNIAEGIKLTNATISACTELPEVEDQTRSVRIQLESFGDEKLSGVLHVAADGKELETRNITFDAAGRIVETFSLSLPAHIEYVMTITLEVDDALKEDNTLTALLPAHVAIPLMVCTPTGTVVAGDNADPLPGVNPFLKAAIAAFGNKVTPSWVNPSQTLNPTPETFRAVIVNSGDGLSAESCEGLKKYVEAGGILMLFPGDNEEPSLEKLVGVSTEGREAYANHEQYQLVTYVAANATLPSLSESGNTLLGFPKAFRYLKIKDVAAEDAGAIQVAVRLDNGRPFLVTRKLGRGTIYYFACSLNPDASDLVLRAGFSPFLYQILEQGVSTTRSRQVFAVGETLVDFAEGATLTAPGDRIVNAPDIRQALSVPGLYHLRSGDQERKLVVRADPEESDLSPMDPERVALLQQGTNPEGNTLAGIVKPKPEEEQSPDTGQNMWWYLMLAAVVCLASESLLASRTCR